MFQKGFAPIILIVGILLGLVGGIYYLDSRNEDISSENRKSYDAGAIVNTTNTSGFIKRNDEKIQTGPNSYIYYPYEITNQPNSNLIGFKCNQSQIGLFCNLSNGGILKSSVTYKTRTIHYDCTLSEDRTYSRCFSNDPVNDFTSAGKDQTAVDREIKEEVKNITLEQKGKQLNKTLELNDINCLPVMITKDSVVYMKCSYIINTASVYKLDYKNDLVTKLEFRLN